MHKYDSSCAERHNQEIHNAFAVFFTVCATLVTLWTMFPRTAQAEQSNRLSGPFVHENLAVYFVHGESAPGPVPLTLQEALDKGFIHIIETGSVNELKIENIGDEEVFIQSGDIVKGGRQDRVLTVSFVLSPKSGEVLVGSFCVEHGRWRARGVEDVTRFSSAQHMLPSRKAKLAMKEPVKAETEAAVETGVGLGRRQGARVRASGYSVGDRQQKIWSNVAETQEKLTAGVGAVVAAPESETSLQLSLENEKLEEVKGRYVKALQGKGEGGGDIIGFVFAVNGQINSADVYPSNGLFRKMWPKLLVGSVTEAIGERHDAPGKAPAVAAVQAFLDDAEKGKTQDAAHTPTAPSVAEQETRDHDKALYVEAKRKSGSWVHRNYLAK